MSEVEAQGAMVEPLSSWQTLLKSFGTLAIGEAVARLFGFVAVIVMARRLGPDTFGLITLGTTLVLWFGIVVDSGTEILNVRDIARRPDRFREIAEPVLGLRLVLSLGAMALFAVAAVVATSTHGDRDVLLTYALVMPMLGLNLRWMVLGVRASKAVATGNIAAQALFACGVLLLIARPHDAQRIPLLQVASEGVYAGVVAYAMARRFGLVRPRVDLRGWWRTLRESGPIMANQIARAVVFSFDVLLIAVLLHRTDVGFYGAAYKPVLFSTAALGLFYMSFLASYSAAAAPQAFRLFRRAVALTGAATIPIALVLSAGAGLVVKLFYGTAYSPAATALAILIWTVPVLAISGAYANALIAAHRQGSLMRNNGIAAAFNVLVNAAAIPLFGIEGAAVVTVASELLGLSLNHRSAVAGGYAPSLSAVLMHGRRAAATRLEWTQTG
jgi:O-antigen/teichoic acid export membrane protein